MSMQTPTASYIGELLVGRIDEVKKMEITQDYQTGAKRIADALSVIISDGKRRDFVQLILPENWPASRFTEGTTWTFGIRSYVNRNGKLTRQIRTDLDPYQDT